MGNNQLLVDDRRTPATVVNGLSTQDAAERLGRFGPNDILSEKKSNWLGIIWDTAKDPMIWLLLFTSALFAWTGDSVEAMVLALAVFPILGMDAFLHRRTAVSVAALAGQLSTTAQVMRDGIEKTIVATNIVPGDVILVSRGDSVPADGAIVAGDSVQVDKSALTGEALPVSKHRIDIDKFHAPIVDDAWLFAGTRLLTGRATLVVGKTGADTLYGQIVRSVQLERNNTTQLRVALNKLVLWLTLAAGLLCIALAATRLAQGHSLVDALVAAATLAVAALPEEFPVVATMFLAFGVHRLALRKALVRHASAVENIGRITAICTDKTGTITEGRLAIAALVPAKGISEDNLLNLAARTSQGDLGDPMDQTLLAVAETKVTAAVQHFPFTEDRRRATTIWRQPNGKLMVATKGAPETIANLCRMPKALSKTVATQLQELTGKGMKVIACASRQMQAVTRSEPSSGFNFAGLIAFSDPLRKGVSDAVERARTAGVRVILVTGDHPATAKAIAREANIGGPEPRLVEGEQLASYLSSNKLDRFDVVARAKPLHKLELVTALKQAGEIVAVTGDGVNDVPALQGADVGIAMGERGTRPAKEAAAIVLLNDSFSTIINAIEEGRRLFWNLRLSFVYLLIVHIPLVLAAAVVPFAGFPLLFLPIHIVWLELIIHPTAILAFQYNSGSSDFVLSRRPPRGFFTGQDWLKILGAGMFTSAAMLAHYMFALGNTDNSLHARSAGLANLILTSAAVTIALAGLKNPRATAIAGITVASLFVATQVRAISNVLSLSPLQWDDWALAFLAATIAALLATNLRKSRPRQD